MQAPLFGQTWNTYYFHHVKHHHVLGTACARALRLTCSAADNGPEDLSSTLRYQRDSVADFVRYFARFFFLVALELPASFLRRRQFWNAAATFGGEAAGLALLAVAMRVAPLAAAVVFLLPFVVVRFGMMSTNWAQHAFVDPASPQNSYTSSTICLAHRYNEDAFNDGYHTSHHLNPRRHWTEHPSRLVQELGTFAAQQPVVFRHIDFMGVWWLLMRRDYDTLAELFVHLGDERPASAEVPARGSPCGSLIAYFRQIVALLKLRTQRLSAEQSKKA